MLFFLSLLTSSLLASNHWLGLSGVYPVIRTLADETTDATYLRKHSTGSILGAVTYGYQASESFYLDLRYEYWISDRKYDLGETTFNHRLNYQTVGMDFGYSAYHPRVWSALVVGAHYPIVAKSGDFSGTRAFQYQARAMLGVRMTKSAWLFIETGWRWANLGILSDGSASYVENGNVFDLSGALISLGALVHF